MAYRGVLDLAPIHLSIRMDAAIALPVWRRADQDVRAGPNVSVMCKTLPRWRFRGAHVTDDALPADFR
jgi:hypothetical protein